MISPALRYCNTPHCRTWTRMEVCPYCQKRDRRTQLNRIADRVIITCSLLALIALGWHIVGRL